MNVNWWNSLRIKIIAWSFVPTVIILSAVAWFTFYSYQRVLGDLIIKQDREILQPNAMQIQQAVSSLVEPIILPIFVEIDKRDEESLEIRAQNILDQTPGLEIVDGGIYFLDRQGVVFKTWPEQSEVIGQDWSDTPHFRFLMEQWNLGAYTDLFSIGSSGKNVICMGIALTNQKQESVGAFYFCFMVYPVTQNAYYQRLASLNLDPNLYVVDRNHRVIYSPDSSEVGKDLSEEAYIRQLSQLKSNGGRFRIGTEDKVVSYVPVSNVPYQDRMGWVLIKEQPWTDIMRPTLPYRQLLLVLLATGVLVPVLVTTYGVRHITEPIQKLIRASEQVTAGKFGHRIEVKTGDEIEALANQFNLMSAELEESYASLEKKVADRTHELATLNAIVAHVSSSLNLNEVMADALERLMELTGMEHGIAYRIEGGEGSVPKAGAAVEEPHLRVMAFRGMPPNFDDLGERLPLRQSAAGVAGTRGEAAIWTLAELPTDSALKDRLVTLGVEQVITIPLITKGRMVGSLNLSTNQSRTYPPEQVAFLNTIGQQIGVAVENARLYEQAEQGAIMAERQRLARELHDSVTQTLFSASLIADVLPRIWQRSPAEGMQNLEELRQLTRGALAEMRTLLLEMRPESIDRADIQSLLTQLAEAFIGRVRVPLELKITGDCDLTRDGRIVFYRVAQEALNNIAKHAGARQVKLYLECQPGQVTMRIQDDGLGFKPGSLPPGHMGMAIMHERAESIGAKLHVDSQVGQGTTVELSWLERKDGVDEHA